MAKDKKTLPVIKSGEVLHGKAYSQEVKTADDKTRSLIVRISTITPDRSNDIVDPTGCDLTNYLKNPVVLLGHDYSTSKNALPIAKCTSISMNDQNIMATILFPDEGIYDVADTVYDMCKLGFLNGISIGFIPTDYMERKDENGWGYTFTKWQLLEFSIVSVPDNQDALIVMRSKGINVDALEKNSDLETAEAAYKTLDEKEEVAAEEIAVETEEVVKTIEKSGRTISAKNEALIQNAIETLQAILADLKEDDADGGADESTEGEKATEVIETKETEVIEVKTVEEKEIEIKEITADPTVMDLLSKMQTHVKHSDKQTGLALKTFKELLTQLATKGTNSDGERN